MKRSTGLAVLSLFAAGMVIVACTVGSNAPVNDHSTIESRYADSCAELATACDAGRGCSAFKTFCGVAKEPLAAFVAIEAGCKDACTDRVCRKDCKLARVVSVAAYIAGADFDGDGEAGDGLTSCPTLATMCEQGNEACTAEEFFCYTTRQLRDPCAIAETACKAQCSKSDRACKQACRDARDQCMAGGGTTTPPDAGVPDSPPPPPDAPTTTTPTGYTYATNIAPKMTSYCNGCHGDATAPAGYRTDSYLGLLGNGSDTVANVIPGDANSLLVVYMANNHKNVNTVFPGFPTVVRDWVVLDKAAQ